MAESTDITTVIVWEDEQVTVWDSAGDVIVAYTGWLPEQAERILRDAREDVVLLMTNRRIRNVIRLTVEMFRSLAEAEAIPDGRH